MILHRHHDLEGASSAPGLFRITSMDQSLGAAAIRQGDGDDRAGPPEPAAHPLGRRGHGSPRGPTARLIGTEVAEVHTPSAFLAPANTVHSLRNVGSSQAVLCIAYPSVNVGTYFVDGIEY